MTNLLSNLIYFDDDSDFPRLSEEFKKRIESALALLQPWAQHLLEATAQRTTYFVVDGDDNPDYDCCRKIKCVRTVRKLIRSKYEKKPTIEDRWTYNDGDHDCIDYCYVCGVPLNTQLTWVEYELEGVEKLSIKDEIVADAFAIYCVLDALPSNDEEIRSYSQNHPDHYEAAVKQLQEFYLRLSNLTDRVIAELSTSN